MARVVRLTSNDVIQLISEALDSHRDRAFTLRKLRGIIREELEECGLIELEEEEVTQVAPPGEESLVKKLKHKKGVDNPWALAWHIHNKKKGK